ncbi:MULTISPECIES: NAD-dependent epimerase/dehydratase family protein [unclassified Phaeobacter]|uniref:NAD-dependent epimerase/dehydratase family protein n=1 Tax=unclassified Phaeobacter TaxID=2621772 RepID=UPI003A85EAB6
MTGTGASRYTQETTIPSRPTGPRHICVAGASGLAGAHITRAALALGWRVTGTLRDATDSSKTIHLMALPGAKERLRLVSANTADPESFAPALDGADTLVIACLPSIRKAPDGTAAGDLDRETGLEHCVIPAQSACHNLIEAAHLSGISDIVLLSSTASAEPENAPRIKNELRHHSDFELQIQQRKFIAAQKTAMEVAAARLAQDRALRLIILLSGMIVGPGVLPCHDQGHILVRLREMAVGAHPWHHQTPKGSMSLIHPSDLAALCLAALQKPGSEGRYFAVARSWQWTEIYSEIAKFVPVGALPTAVPKGTDPVPPTQFDFTRRDSLAVPRHGLAAMIASFFHWLDRHDHPDFGKVTAGAHPTGATNR